jgi:probable F420-dependent oxidoreductase
MPSASPSSNPGLPASGAGREPRTHDQELKEADTMALKDLIPIGMSLPHRSPDAIDMTAVRTVAERAEALGFSDLWVTENTLDHVFSFDPDVILTYAAALTRRIRLGVAVTVLPVHDPRHVAHRFATLDYVSGGRAILGLGLGRAHHYEEFQVPTEHRLTRLREGIEVVRALWTQPKVDYAGSIYRLESAGMVLKPVQKPHPPIWLGGDHPNALRRAAALGDGWMGSGGSSIATFKQGAQSLRAELERRGRDPATFPISKRVFLSVDDDVERARAEVVRWFGVVYRNADRADGAGLYGKPAHVREQLEALVAAGANHLLVNPVARYAEQVETLAEIVGLS